MRTVIASFLCLALVLSPTLPVGAQLSVQEITFLSLDDAIQLAYRRNLQIQIAELDLSIKKTDLPDALSRYDTDIEISSDYEVDEAEQASTVAGTKSDTANLNFALTRLLRFGSTLAFSFFNQRNATNSTFATLNPHHTSDFEASITQPLLKNWGGIIDRSEVKITRIDIEQFDLDTQDRIEEVLADCEETYWELVRAQEGVRIKTRGLQQAQKFLNINKGRIQTGLIERPDLLAAEANLRQRELDVLIAEHKLTSASNDLRLILSLDIPARIRPTESPTFDKQVAFLDASLLAAFTNRRDYLKAKKEIEEKKILLAMKKNERWPELDLTATLTGNGLDPHWEDAAGEAFAADNPTFFVGLSASFPLEGRKEKAELSRAGLEKAQAILSFQHIELIVIKEVDEGVRDVNLAAVEAEKTLEIDSLQEEKLKEEAKKFSYGRSDSDTMVRFQDDALDASDASLNAIINHKIALTQLARTENTLLSKYERQLNAHR